MKNPSRRFSLLFALIALLGPALSACSSAKNLPSFVNHAQPNLVVDMDPFVRMGCTFDEYGLGTCPDHSPLAGTGCERISAAYGLLGGLEPLYPIARCIIDVESAGGTAENVTWGSYSYKAEGDYFFCVGGEWQTCCHYVIIRDDQFVVVRTEDEFRSLFSPVETADEALSYVLAVTGLSAYYGLEPDLALEYQVDTIEDTHVEITEDGYVVHLFHRAIFGCYDFPFSAVDFHLTPQGHIKEMGQETIYTTHIEGFCRD